MEHENKVAAEISAKTIIEPNDYRNIEITLDGDDPDMLVLISVLTHMLIKRGIEPGLIFAAAKAGIAESEILAACTTNREEL